MAGRPDAPTLDRRPGRVVHLRNHAYPTLGRRPIGAVRRSEVQAWVRGRSQVLEPASVETLYRWVSTIFKAAVGDRLIPTTPCDRIALPKKSPRRVVPLEVGDVERMAVAVPERYRALIVLGAGTGMRQGESFGLSVDRVDFLRRTATVDRQITGARGGVPTFGPPKTQSSHRTIPLPQTVVDALAEHLSRFNAGPHGLIFSNSLGAPLRRSAFGETWHRAAATAALPSWATFHDLRHFYASLLIARNCSIKTVQHRLGHQSATETLDTYSHLWPDSDEETRAAVDGTLFRLPGDVTTLLFSVEL